MSKKNVIQFTLLAWLGLAAAGAWAANTTRYVTDELTVTLRTGRGTDFRIRRHLVSGTEVQVLSTHKKSGYSKVRLADGVEGWVLSRFLVDQPSARDRLPALEQQLAALEPEMQRLRTAADDAEQKRQEAERQRQEVEEKNAQLQKRMEEIRVASNNAVQLVDENRSLKNSLNEAHTELRKLRKQYDFLKDENYRNWFLAGAVVVVFSMMLGIMLSRVRWRKRSSWSDLK